MFEVVASNWMRDYLKGKREFTDWEKATLIWNSPVHIWRERLDSLKELAAMIEDDVLKRQIDERISFEERGYQLFIRNQDKNYVYVLFDDERRSCGFFSDYETARLYGIRYCKKYECGYFAVEKQLLYGKDTVSKVIHPWGSIFEESGYDGTENARASYNREGELRIFCSLEMSPEDNDKVDEMSRKRFEYRFFKIPFGMESGTVVKILDSGKYAVLDQGKEAWDEYMTQTDADPEYYDFSDIQIIAFVLKEDGHWSHVHVNPLYLEPELPDVEAGDKKETAHRNALIALSSYLQNGTKTDNENAIKASRMYAEECACYKNWSRIVYEADDIEEMLC